MSPAKAARRSAGTLLRAWTRPLVRRGAIERLPGWVGTLHSIKVPANVEPNPERSTAGSANIRIIFQLLESTLAVPGNVAECGVWQGSTLLPTGLFLRRRAPTKRLIGFDSFQGLNETVSRDVVLGGDVDERKRVGGFSNTSYEAVNRRVAEFGLSDTTTLVPGYFQDTLAAYADWSFSFVHLDCVIYESYRTCLEFFYPRLVAGGVILLDEYMDPPWPGCTLAVDEFLKDKREQLTEVTSDNHTRYYLLKL
jgi:hypothetical protein